MNAEYIDRDNGKPICGRCAAESGKIKTDKNGIWKGLHAYKGNTPCWSCEQMLNEDMIDVSDAMTPEEIEAAEKAEREYRRKFAASGGSAKSPRKAAASRMNGKKGGRPRKVKS